MASNTIHVGACPTCGALAQAIAGEVTTYRHIATRPADSDKSKPQMMINRSGEIHEYSPDCRGECSDLGSSTNPTVWEHTLNEYERSILAGDIQGAAILRALVLERIAGSKLAESDWEWQAALEINRDGDSANTIPIAEIIRKHRSAPPPVTDCAFCGKNLTECECPQPL